jgi:putative oxidoreductase
MEIKSCAMIECASCMIRKAVHYANLLQPLVTLAVRLYMARLFFLSGLTKIEDWHKTLDLFANTYQVPLLPVALAAFLGTAVELICPVMLLLGLGTRLAALALMVQTGIIISIYPEYSEHYYWLMLLAMLLAYGAGKISADYLLLQKFKKVE